MAQITLSKYLRLIDELIDESRLAEAVAHSRHLLEQHPRHIDTYRRLGKALLEQGDYAGAVDIFQRVLSAMPADFVAHAGLAIVHKAGDRWKQALWHMERAFEVEPYNAAIRTELQELYGRRDGLAPARVELTRGALARLYVKGGLYQQAILELREMLAEEPERVDLKLLLAEAHWRAEERVEAAEQCEAILELLPDCIDAHAMLADIMLATGDTGSAMPHLERLQALTQLSQSSLQEKPALADLFNLPGAPALPREITVDRLSDAEALGLQQQQEAAAWISELDLEAENVEDDLGWLQELQEEGGESGPEVAAPAEEIPDWLAAATTVRQPEETEPDAPAVPPEEPVESAAGWAESLSELPEEEIDWREAPEEPVAAPDWMAAADEEPGWLEQPVETQTPDWLAETEPPEAPDAGLEEASDQGEPLLSDWLGEVLGAEQQESAHPAEEEWASALTEGSRTGEEEAGPVEEEAFVEGGEAQVWEYEADREGMVMEERGNEQGEQPEAHDAEEEAPDLDWLQQLGQPEPATEPGAKQPEAEAGVAGELPDWLGDEGELDWLDDEAGAEPELPAGEGPADEDLSWLDQIAGGQAEPPEEMPTLEWPDEAEPELPEEPELAATVEDEESPAGEDVGLDWLDALASEGDAVTASWLDELAEEEELPAAGDETSDPQLFSEDIADLDWLEESTEQPDAGLEDEPFDWLSDSGLPPEAEGVAADIFAAEEAEEPVLDYLEAAADTTEEPEEASPEAGVTAEAPDVPEDLQEAMAWLDELPAQAESPEAQDVPEDLDEAMAWLEQLAAKQGAPVEELPSVTAAAAAVGSEDAESEPEQAPMLDETPELVLPDEETPEPHLEWMETLAEDAGTAAPSGDDFEVPADLDDAMAWLEEMAEQEEPGALPEWLQDEEAGLDDFAGDEGDLTAVTEEPLPETGDETMADVPEDLDEALAWLEQLAAQQGAPAEELPSLQESGDLPEEPAEEPAEAGEDAAPAMEITPAMETPPAMQVPDVAMMYLDSLLVGGWPQAGPGAPELADELPDDAESALAWLEQLAREPVTETSMEEEEPGAEPVASLDWLEEPEAGTGVAEEAEVEEWAWTEQLPEPEQWEETALPTDEAIAGEAEAESDEWAWTEQLPEPEQWEEAEPDAALPTDEAIAGEAEAEIEEWAWTDELPEPEQWEETGPAPDEAAAELPAAEETTEEAFDDIPEDPDEAMAWLERLAARQGAPLDELPSVDEISDEIETPDWLARELADAGPALPELPDAEAVSGEMDWLEDSEGLDWLEDTAVEEAPAEPELPESPESAPEEAPDELPPVEAGFDLDILAGEEMEPALPEWLAGGDESWPAELTDIDSWLVAEEEASRIDMPVPEPARPAPPAPEPAPLPEPAPTERIPAPEGSDAARLEQARTALDAGDVEAAIAAYHDFMGGGSGLNVVIADLEMATAANEEPMLLRLLGDAYMENGQLNRALEAYRRALDLL